MPLNGESRRIYPEPVPRTQSPAHYKPGSFGHQTASSGAIISSNPPGFGSARQKTAAGPPFGSRKDFDGSSDQYNGPAMTLGQPGPMRAGSKPQKPNTATPSRIKADASNTAAQRASIAAGVKMEVPNTLTLPRAPPMKHQTSQSTDSSVQDRGWRQNGNNRGADRQTPSGSNVMPLLRLIEYDLDSKQARRDAVDEVDDDTSLTFDHGRYDDYGEDDRGPPAEPTALFRGAPVNTENVISDFAHGLSSHDIAAARQWNNNRAPFRDTQVTFDLATGVNLEEEDQYDAEPVFNDDSTEMFNDDDKADFLHQQRRRDEKTPSKPPVAILPATKRPGQATVKKVSVQAPAQHRERDRSSSPLPLEELDAYKKYGKEHLNEFRQERAQREHAVPESPAGLPTASKVPESHGPSEDERPPEQNAQRSPSRKRPFGQIDYDADTLTNMAYADLDAVPFLSDPRAPAPETAMDANGTPITLEQRLANLSRMKQDDQKSLFRSLTDAENEDVGQWFIQKFADDLKRLMETRLERRKVALRYEMEAKKRHQEVEVKSADLTSELHELKKGGSQLIEGRGSPRPPKPL